MQHYSIRAISSTHSVVCCEWKAYDPVVRVYKVEEDLFGPLPHEIAGQISQRLNMAVKDASRMM